MNTYVTGATVKQLREKRNLTQTELAEKIGGICIGEKNLLPADFCRNSRSHASASLFVINPLLVLRDGSPSQFL